MSPANKIERLFQNKIITQANKKANKKHLFVNVLVSGSYAADVGLWHYSLCPQSCLSVLIYQPQTFRQLSWLLDYGFLVPTKGSEPTRVDPTWC